VPIPGEPCRSEDDALAPSRIKDDFKLEFDFNSPEQREEQALRNFVAWLAEIPIKEDDGAATLEEFLKALREANLSIGHVGSSLFIHPSNSCDFLHAAFRIWVTELRPTWLGTDQTSAGSPPSENCVFLARLRIPVLLDAGVWKVKVPTDDLKTHTEVSEDDRPYVLSLRMVQEWMMCGRSQQGGMAGPKGAKGDPGEKGDPGLNGVNGAPGLNGADGAPGLNGVDGAPGQNGLKGPPGDSRIIAAGCFDRSGQPIPAPLMQLPQPFTIDLTATRFPGDQRFFLLNFGKFIPTGFFVVKGTVLIGHEDPPHYFEVVSVDIENIDKLISRIGETDDERLLKYIDTRGQTGIVVRISQANNFEAAFSIQGFMVEISSFGGG
jgi:Collagen triple helix repeat (20 copies)